MADVTEEHADIWILLLQERHPCGSFPKRQLHLAGRQNQSRQTLAQCWQTPQNLLHSSVSHEKKNNTMRFFFFFFFDKSLWCVWFIWLPWDSRWRCDVWRDLLREWSSLCSWQTQPCCSTSEYLQYIQNCHIEMANAICEIMSRLTHPPQCQALVQDSYTSGSRSYHPMSRRWGRD